LGGKLVGVMAKGATTLLLKDGVNDRPGIITRTAPWIVGGRHGLSGVGRVGLHGCRLLPAKRINGLGHIGGLRAWSGLEHAPRCHRLAWSGLGRRRWRAIN